MRIAPDLFEKSPEAVLVGLSRTGNRDELVDTDAVCRETPGAAMDLDYAPSTLADDVRLCIVLSYHEQMTHKEIESHTGIPLGTVKSHIRRGTRLLQERLAANAKTREEPK